MKMRCFESANSRSAPNCADATVVPAAVDEAVVDAIVGCPGAVGAAVVLLVLVRTVVGRTKKLSTMVGCTVVLRIGV